MEVIVCPTCSTQYQIDKATLTNTDTLRCKKCKAVFSLRRENEMFSSIAGGLENTTILDKHNIPQDVTGNGYPGSDYNQGHSQMKQAQHEGGKQPFSQDMSSHGKILVGSSAADHDFVGSAAKIRNSLDSHKGLETIFKKEGKLIEVRGNKPLLLNTSEYVWLVNSGTIDIFSVRIDEHGEVVGARSHLLRLETGQIVFGIDAKQYGKERVLLTVGTLGSSLLELDVTRLQTLSRTSEVVSGEIGELIDKWIGALSLSIKKSMTPKNCINLDSIGEIQLRARTNYQSKKGIRWVKHISGASTFMGRIEFPEIGENGYFPVYEKIWLQTIHKTRLYSGQTAEIIKQDSFWASLENFHLFTLDCVTIHEKQRIAEEEVRLKQKAEDETASLKNAFFNLVSVVKAEKAISRTTATTDPLLSACKAIGKHLNIPFTSHPDAQKGWNSLEDIVKASRVRMRQVVLKEKWWYRDNGPLLAYKEKEKTPVALLPVSPRKYILFDPIQGTRVVLTEKVAESLSGLAYTFYIPFPDKTLSLSDLLKLGFWGTGRGIMMVILMGILGALLGMITPIVTGILFNDVIPGAATDQLVQIGAILVVCAVATAIFEVTKAISMLRIEGKADHALQAAIMDRLLTLPTSFFRKYTAGDLARRTLGINAIRQILAGLTVRTILAGIFSLFYMVLLFYYSWYLALFALVISLFSLIVTSALGYVYVRYEQPINEIEGKISGVVLQLIVGISKLRITGTEDRAFALWTESFSAKRKLAFKSRQIQNILATVNAIIPVLASMILYYVVLSQIMNPEKQGLSIGDFLAFFAAYGTLQVTLMDMSLASVNSLQVIPFYKRLKPILTTLPEIDTTKSYPGEITGNIEVTQMNFRYQPDGPLILNDVSLHINNGEFIAIVGGSGSGKSTLMRLLLGFETPESGAIYYDGQDLSKIDILEIRRQIGVVLQNSQIMAGSIYDNIVGAGSATLTLDDAWEAARMAGCYEDIKAMPMEMHTYLPPGGGSLSGGQRQRILIARAIVKKPRVLFFDEATSALDNKTQAIVSESIEQLQSTRIVIAHRLSTIMHADRIYAMDKGRIVQCGTYDELMAQEGLFAELAKRQLA